MPKMRRILNTGAVLTEPLNNLADLQWRWTVGGAPKMSGSPFGQVLTLNGVTDYLYRGEKNWRGEDSEGAVSCWIKLDAVDTTYVIWASSNEVSYARFLYLYIDSTNVIAVAQHNNLGAVDTVFGTTTTFIAGRWYHIALVSDGSSYTLYVNGFAEGLSVQSGTNRGDWLADTNNRNNMTIGVLDYGILGGYLQGKIRDLIYYPRALTGAEVLNLATHKAF